MPKKKRGSRDKKNKKSPWLNERETLFYEQQILDNNRQLARYDIQYPYNYKNT